MLITGSVALVTGGAQGIGKAISSALLSRGAKVCVADYSDLGQETVNELTAQYGDDKAIFVKCDVRSLKEVEDAFERVIKTFGRIDIVANNAGVNTEADYEKTVDINLTGVMRVMQTALKHMDVSKGGNGGVIINTASMASFVVGHSTPTYTAAKHGVLAYTRCFAMPYHYEKHRVRLNCICPGFVDTNMCVWEEVQIYDPDFLYRIKAQLPSLVPADIAAAFIQIVEDDTKCGEALKVMNGQPATYHTFPDS